MLDTSKTILTVDDFASMRRIMRTMLRQLGYHNIVEAEDGAVAFDLLKREKVDFIISDWNMPNMSGLEFIKAVRGDDSLKTIPVLLVTAEVIQENVVEAVQAGVNNYVIKPFTAEVLQEKIDAIFGA